MIGETGVTTEVQRYWDDRATTFNGHTLAKLTSSDWLSVYTHALKVMLPNHTGTVDVLDVGVGTGFTAVLLAEAGHRVTGIDISMEMLARAGQDATSRGVDIRLINGTAHPLPALAGTFDIVTCRNLLWTLPNPAAALAGWRSVLRPDGAVLVSDAMWNVHLEKGPRPRSCPYGPISEQVYGKFLDSYLPLRGRLPYFSGLNFDDAQYLLRTAGYRHCQRFDSLFKASPQYSPPPGFFVIGARSLGWGS